MASDDIKSTITGWCTTEDSLQFVEDLSDPGADFALTLRAGNAVSGTVPVRVALQSGADRVTVSSTLASAPDVAALRDRPAIVRADGSDVTGAVYLDGFTRNAFMQVVAEVAKTANLLGVAPAGAAAASTTSTAGWSERPGETAAVAAAGDTWSPQAAQSSTLPGGTDAQPVTPGGGTLPSPSFGAATPAQPQPQAGWSGYTPAGGQPAVPAQPAPQPTFTPTHAVPPQGMQAWTNPDPNGPVVATLGGGLPIQVTEVRGAWARVLCSNGWTGWVDGRIIGVAR